MDTHAKFHREAGKVAQAVNAGKVEQALRMLADDSAFTAATRATVMAIHTVQSQIKKPTAPSQAPAKAAAKAAAFTPSPRAAAPAPADTQEAWESF